MWWQYLWAELTSQWTEVGTRLAWVSATVLCAVLLLSIAGRTIRLKFELGHLSRTMALRLRLGVRWLVVAVALLAVLQQSGVFRQAWAVFSATLAALAVGFVASWSVLSNSTCAILILLYRPFRVGDDIDLIDTDGDLVIRGVVVDLNLMFTTLQHDQTAVVRIPNNLIVQRLVRVRRDGSAPDVSLDAGEPFFEASAVARTSYRKAADDLPLGK